MRYVLAALLVVTCQDLVLAQQQTPAQAPLPSIGLPLPPIGLPLPPIGLDAATDQPAQPAPPRGPGGRPQRPLPAVVFFGAPYAFGVDPSMQSPMPGMIAPPAEVVAPPLPETGTLRLEVEPADVAQVFVDGEYVGTPADLAGEIELTPGAHRIEIRARGHETLTFDARVVSGRTLTYRETMVKTGGAGKESAASKERDAAKDVVPRTSPSSPARPKTTFYLIPGCYLGNVHPDQVKLPPDCDFSKMITHTPGS
jgi:hypothetical protein